MYRFAATAGPSALHQRICLVHEAWERGYDKALPHLSVATRKAYPATAMAFALGPQCNAELPGWSGDLILTPEQVLRTLPAVERAFTWTTRTRRRAEPLLAAALHPEGDREDIDALLDGVPRSGVPQQAPAEACSELTSFPDRASASSRTFP
ncbi:hypothetical protein [Kitasatospora sp. NPDC091207]|uniref:hypothetical protein n=1 Tax=Kitasatospora sp. NPDC091207 TaxID=3364083 RepID=UPI003819C00C